MLYIKILQHTPHISFILFYTPEYVLINTPAGIKYRGRRGNMENNEAFQTNVLFKIAL